MVVDSGPPPSAGLKGVALEVARRLGSRGDGELRFEIRGNLVLGEYRLAYVSRCSGYEQHLFSSKRTIGNLNGPNSLVRDTLRAPPARVNGVMGE